MRRILLFALALLIFPFLNSPAKPDSAMVVTTCGTLPQAYVPGAVRAVTQDTTGKECVNATVSAVVTVDTITSSTQTKLTIAVTNTYQQALASSSSRKGCLLQNNGTHTAYVFFGAAPADTTTSFQLSAGQGISCAVGGIATLGTAVNVTGTAGDVIVVSSQ